MSLLLKIELCLLPLQLGRVETLKYRCGCRPRSEKFNIVSNDHGRTQKRDFCVSVGKTNFTDHHTPDQYTVLENQIWSVRCVAATARYGKTLSIFIPSHEVFS